VEVAMIWINERLYHSFPWLCWLVAIVASMGISSPLKWPFVVYLVGYVVTVFAKRFF